MSLTSPPANAELGLSFTITGTASCEAYVDQLGEPGIFQGDSTQSITTVDVRLGTNPFAACHAHRLRHDAVGDLVLCCQYHGTRSARHHRQGQSRTRRVYRKALLPSGAHSASSTTPRPRSPSTRRPLSPGRHPLIRPPSLGLPPTVAQASPWWSGVSAVVAPFRLPVGRPTGRPRSPSGHSWEHTR